MRTFIRHFRPRIIHFLLRNKVAYDLGHHVIKSGRLKLGYIYDHLMYILTL